MGDKLRPRLGIDPLHSAESAARKKGNAMDGHQMLAHESEFTVCVLGKGEDFVLVPVSGDASSGETLCEYAAARGFSYCGCMGVVNGKAAAKSLPDLDSAFTMMHAAFAFASLAADRLKRPEGGDFVEWANRLWSLPDPRD